MTVYPWHAQPQHIYLFLFSKEVGISNVDSYALCYNGGAVDFDFYVDVVVDSINP